MVSDREMGYTTKEDFRKVAAGYRENHIPLDMIYMDIDYMDSYKDFTVESGEFSLISPDL